MMEIIIFNSRTSFYIPEIQKLLFNIPHVQILVTNDCVESRQTSFKIRGSFEDVLCRRNFAERVAAIFLIKYNQNNAVEIYPFLFRSLHWNILVH